MSRRDARGPSARGVALEVIRRVIDEGAYSNRLVGALLARSGLDRRDRAFASELAYGTLRHRLRLDAAVATAARRPIERITPAAAHALRLGAYQLLVAGVAPHAAVGETVRLVDGRERGFVNAVLRRLADAPPPPPSGTDDAAVGARTGMRAWAVRELRALLGDEADEAAAAFAAQGRLSLRATGDRDALVTSFVHAGVEASPGPLDPSSVLVRGGDPASFPGFEDGAFAVQDTASILVVRALDPAPGQRVLDVCAAPGGKALFAAGLVGTAGSVIAADAQPGRLPLIVAEAARLHLAPVVVAQDATRPALDAAFERVLVDAPCSGIGSARRRPELLWRVPEDRVTPLAARQLAIVRAAAGLLAPGGRLVYSVCTFPRAETDGVLDVVERALPALRPVPTDGPDGRVTRHRLWPHRHDSDGMFYAAYEHVG